MTAKTQITIGGAVIVEQRAWEVLENGVPGTAMPPWKNELSDDERRALVECARSLHGTPLRGSTR